jgi:UDP:flavonoid glycosyltransferase YjiC (YdhE family)
MGGSSEGLACGTPVIAAPQAVDQFDNADRLVALGVARRVDTATVTAEQLRAALLGLVGDPAVRARAAGIQRELREQAGADRAADLVEAELPRVRPLRRPPDRCT